MKAAVLALSVAMLLSPAVQAAQVLEPTSHLKKETQLADLQGKWLGSLQIPDGPTLTAGIELFTRADGQIGANMVSPDQGVSVMPIDAVTWQNGELTVAASAIGAQIVLRPEAGSLVGSLNQGDAGLPMDLKRVEAFPDIERPQTPKAPLPYGSEEVRFQSTDGTWLAGTLTRPAGIKKPTVVVLVAGSGPADRDASIMGHKPFLVLADHLSRNGYAVLRFDKRGVMRSAGSFADAALPNLINDAKGAVQYLAASKQFRAIGLLGHSEGSAVVAEAARDNKHVSFVISAAGVGLPGIDAIVLQDDAELKLKGVSDAERAVATGYSRRFYEAVAKHAAVADREAAIAALKASLTESEQKLVKQHTSGWVTVSMHEARGERLRALLLSNAPASYAALNVPVLALNGDKDVQVPAAENLAGLSVALKHNKNAKVISLPSLNHLLQTATTGLTEEYPQIDETMAPLALTTISDYLKGLKL